VCVCVCVCACRDHGQTVARLMSVGARHSAGFDAFTADREIRVRSLDDRIYRAPQSALDLPSARASSTKNTRENSNPLKQRVCGNLRRGPAEIASRGTNGRGRGAVRTGAQSPMSKMVGGALQSPESPLRGAYSPLPARVGECVSASRAMGADGFAKGKSNTVSRHHEKDKALSSLFGTQADTAVLPTAGGKFGSPVTKKNGGGWVGGGSSAVHKSK